MSLRLWFEVMKVSFKTLYYSTLYYIFFMWYCLFGKKPFVDEYPKLEKYKNKIISCQLDVLMNNLSGTKYYEEKIGDDEKDDKL